MTTQSESPALDFKSVPWGTEKQLIICPYGGVFFMQQMDHWLRHNQIDFNVTSDGWILSSTNASYFLARWVGMSRETILKKIQEQVYQKD